MPCYAILCHASGMLTPALLYVGLAQTGACESDLVSLKGLAACSPCGDNHSAPRPFFFFLSNFASSAMTDLLSCIRLHCGWIRCTNGWTCRQTDPDGWITVRAGCNLFEQIIMDSSAL